MSIRDEVIDAFRAWAKTCLGLTDAQVIRGQRGVMGPHPARPFLVVELTSFDARVGTDEQVLKTDGNHRQGVREGIVSVTSYGEGGEDWLVQLNALTDKSTDPLTVIDNDLAPVDVSAEYGEEVELRYEKTWDVRYAQQLTTPDTSRVPVETIDIGLNIKGGNPPDIVVQVDEDWS